MIPINNSDFAWLVTADYNQDNNIGFPDELREDILNPEVDIWHYEYKSTTVGAGPGVVGSICSVGVDGVVGGGSGFVGIDGGGSGFVGTGGIASDISVIGGNRYDPD